MEVFNQVKKRTNYLLDEIINDTDNYNLINEINNDLITFRKPSVFGGVKGVEVSNKIDFEKSVTVLEKWLGFKIDNISVLRFFSYLEELKEENKKHKNG